MIEFECSKCRKMLRVNDEAAGKQGKCPHCSTLLVVPQNEMIAFEFVESVDINTADDSVSASKVDEERHRTWVILLIIGTIISVPFLPQIALWLGIGILFLCFGVFFPKINRISNIMLRISPLKKWRYVLRLFMYGLIGITMIFFSFVGMEVKDDRNRVVVEKMAAEKEQQRLTNEANSKVQALVSKAQAAWQQGNYEQAVALLQSAENIPNATNHSSIRRLHTEIANSQVDSLMAEARSFLMPFPVMELRLF